MTSTSGYGRRSRAGTPVAATQRQLLQCAQAHGHSIYWIGAYADFTYELTETANHEIYIRYLPAGALPGDPSHDYTTIGTYPIADAYAMLMARVERGELSSQDISNQGIATWDDERPSSVYLAYPEFPFVIEVYDPIQAHKIATSGEVGPVRAPESAPASTNSVSTAAQRPQPRARASAREPTKKY